MTRPAPLNCDVVVLGAGAAGLAAAADLSSAGFVVKILEARDRIGGRVHTLHEPRCPHPIELGAEFVHGRPDEVFQIIRQAKLLACDADGEHWHLKGSRLRKAPEAWGQINGVLDRLAKAFPKGREKDESFGQFVARSKGIRPGERELATLFVEGFNASPAGRVSARWLADAQRAEAMGGADEQFRLPGGYDRVIRQLQSRCDPERCVLWLRHVAQKVEWRDRRVTVHSTGPDAPEQTKATSAPAVLVTLPLGVLKAGGVQFEGPLPSWKREAIDALGFGSVVKVVIQFSGAFWERRRMPSMGRGQDLSKMAFMHSRDESFPTWWTWCPLRAPTLTGWAGGPAADRLAGKAPGELYAEALASLGRFFGVKAGDLDGDVQRWWVADWHADPYARGAYSYVPAGASGAVAKLAAPVDGTVFFAGEATEPAGHSGTVAGAIASGRRAAREIVSALRRR
jgi:monoamine oxidase